jgi:NAD(P)-dependent dehydrogenase (short-subunit alcohol dehydrogenase family)
MTKKRLDGKVALVIGGSTGIGRATAVAFGQAGATVVLAGRGRDRGKETEALVQQTGVEALFIETDVTSDLSVRNLIDRTIDKFGRIDAAFNNAGIEGKVAPIADTTETDFDSIIDTNLKGVYLGLKYQVAQMLKNGGGTIVNTASIGGVIGFPNTAIYCASKHAVIGLTKTVALELADANIRVNAIAPGAVQTGLLNRMSGGEEAAQGVAQAIPMKRISKPEEIADAVVWLCSDEASYITGHTLVVDGGFTVQ